MRKRNRNPYHVLTTTRLPVPWPRDQQAALTSRNGHVSENERGRKDSGHTIFSTEAKSELDCVNSHTYTHMDTLSASEDRRQGGEGG
jgi:hypothetical protein